MDEIKKYLLDGRPVNARELIRAAQHVRLTYDENLVDRVYFTSESAEILRAAGFEVEENPEYAGV